MQKYLIFLKGVLILALLIFILIVSYFYFYFYPRYRRESMQISINRLITIISFIIFFCTLLILIDFNLYNRIFAIIITVGTILWIGIYLLELLKIRPEAWNWTAVRDFAAIISLSILAPGFTLNIIKFIKNNSNKNKKRKVFKKYHIHEGFVGVLFLILGVLFLIIRYFLIQHEVMRKKFRIFLAVDMILLYLFVFSGSFLIFRDRRDLLRLKFIEKRDTLNTIHNSSAFSPITLDSFHFFKTPRILYYPFGIILSSLSVNLLIHGTDFLGVRIFSLSQETIVLIGFFFCLLAGLMIGIDWYRLFAKLYPNLYEEIEEIIRDLKTTQLSRNQT